MSGLAVIVPTRGRPEAVRELVAAWEDTGATAALVFGVDDDDPRLGEYRGAVETLDDEHDVELVIGPRLRMVGTLNKIARDLAPRFDALGFMGDDHRPRTPRWDQMFAEVLADRPRIAYGDDGYQHEAMATAVCMTSDIVTALGYMAPPELTHLRADVVWCEWGAAIDRLTYRPDIVIEHMHPWAGKGQWDAGYGEANSQQMIHADAHGYALYKADGFERDVDRLRGLLP